MPSSLLLVLSRGSLLLYRVTLFDYLHTAEFKATSRISPMSIHIHIDSECMEPSAGDQYRNPESIRRTGSSFFLRLALDGLVRSTYNLSLSLTLMMSRLVTIASPASSPRAMRLPETLVRRPQPLPGANPVPLGAVEYQCDNAQHLGTRSSASAAPVDPSRIVAPSAQTTNDSTRADKRCLVPAPSQYKDDASTAETKHEKAQRELDEERKVTRQLRAALNESRAQASNAMVYARVLEDYVRAVEVYMGGLEDNIVSRLQDSSSDTRTSSHSEHTLLSHSRASRLLAPPGADSSSLSGYNKGTSSKLKRSRAEYENEGRVHAESCLSSPEKVLKTS
ncbi:hypothetical protein BDZ89DRAFT_1119044 [Hymenopellis radicata]|nr:hypothetical protein BDZ89DRAFT_1119044 [Hymenopellis radicata]